MQKRQWGRGLAVLALALSLSFAASALTAERHPQIHAAMRALNQAAHHLERAEHDFGGHRAKALEMVRQAEGELREALQYAKAHPSMEAPKEKK